ncbi:hypothetical protein [Pareuzebyella sediminis]|nr:hypothetical protein [Pareuzebyella sediminis]
MASIAHENQKLIVEQQWAIGKFSFYTNVVVSELAEGIHATKDKLEEPIQYAQQIYNSKTPVIYISHRLNSYSFDPVAYGEIVAMFPNLIGFAIVSTNRYRRMLASLEKLFIKRPISVFYDLEEAFIWAEKLIGTHIPTSPLR